MSGSRGWTRRLAWVERLSGVEPSSLDIEWFSESRSEEIGRGLAEALTGNGPPGYPLLPAALGACREHDVVALAGLPSRLDRRGRAPYRPTLFADASRPEQAWLAFEPTTPPIYWVPAGTSARSLAAARAAYEVRGYPHEHGLRARGRWFVGHEEELGVDFGSLADALGNRACVDGLAWGTEHDLDPWGDRVRGGALGHSLEARRNLAQRADAMVAVSVRTVFSGSVVTLRTFEGFLSVEARYRPSAHPEAVRALNERLGAAFPEDLPMDVVAPLFGLPMSARPPIEELLRDPREERWRVHALSFALLAFDDLSAMQWLLHDALGASAERRGLAAELAHRFELHADLLRMLTSETDPALREELLLLTALGAS